MKVKVISNGKRNGTHLVNAETGEEIENVRSITWSIGITEEPYGETDLTVWVSKIVVTFLDVEAELIGEVRDEMHTTLTLAEKAQEMARKRKGTKSMRTKSGGVSAAARRKHGMKGTKGKFPIFDTKSARSAIKLRGHAKSKAARRNIINRAAKYAPSAAAKARKVDAKR